MSVAQFVQTLNALNGGNVYVTYPDEWEVILKGASKDVTVQDLEVLPVGTSLSFAYDKPEEKSRYRAYWKKTEGPLGSFWHPTGSIKTMNLQ